MPYLSFDVEVDDFLSSCDRRDITDLIDALVEDGHLPKGSRDLKNIKTDNIIARQGRGEEEFSEKLQKFKSKYYSLSQEDEDILNVLFKKYI